MDLDKIVEDLIEKRLSDRLAISVSNELERGALLNQFVQDCVQDAITKHRDAITAAVGEAIKNITIDGSIIPSVSYQVSFNVPTYKIKEMLAKAIERQL
jgi:uncharacterized phage protein gp47/JayE